MNFVKAFFILIIFSCLFYACAVETAPLGGPKDETPPQLDTLKSTANYQLNYEKQTITLVFDEWIELSDVFNQVMISPPLLSAPDITYRGKKIKFHFPEDEILKEDVTYTINFGESIKDYTQGNIQSNFRFVFSTGDELDSLRIRGVVLDAETKKPAEEVFVLLYDKLTDSIVYQERPYYFAKTNKNGQFSFENIREDSFKLFVLGDKNLNYIYDQEAEGTGFLLDPIYVNDTLPGTLEIEYFTPALPLQFFENIQKEYGLIKLVFNRSPYDLDLDLPENLQPAFQEIRKDSLIISYGGIIDQDTIFIQLAENNADTIALKSFDREDFLNKKPRFIQIKEASSSSSYKKLYAKTPVIWNFSEAISQIDTTKLIITRNNKDTIPFSLKLDSLQNNFIVIDFKRMESDSLKATVMPGFVTGIRGFQNDTSYINMYMDLSSNYGSIYLSLDSLNANFQYVIQLKKGNNVLEELIVKDKASEKLNFIGMKPGEYGVHIIEDKNKNGRWDPGNYAAKEFSERWIDKKLQALRANWDLEAKINWQIETEGKN
jgi:hypothetical protein